MSGPPSRAAQRPQPSAGVSESARSGDAGIRGLIPILLVIGFCSFLAQVILLREVSVASFGNELILVLALGAWLFWSAVGAVAGRRTSSSSTTSMYALLLGLAVAVVFAVVFLRGSHRIFGGIAGTFLPLPMQVLSLSVALAPVALLTGALFRVSARRYVAFGGTVATAYAIESSGAILGGLGATWALSQGWPVLVHALACGALAAAAVGLTKSPRSLRLAGGVFAVVLLGAIAGGRPLDLGLTSWSHPGVVASADTPYSRITITEQAGQVAVYSNNALAYETEGFEAEQLVHVAALQCANPRRVLVLGGGADGLVREVLRHDPEAVVYVELDSRFLNLLVSRLPQAHQRSLEAPEVQIVTIDPRTFLHQPGAYDVILIGMPEPSSGQTGRYYSREFFRLCAARLAPGGVVGLRMRSSENLWTRTQVLRTASVVNALRSSFAAVQVLPGSLNLLLGSQSDLSNEPAVLAERRAKRGIESALVTDDYLEYLYSNDRRPQFEQLMAENSSIVHTDDRPVGYQLSQLLWLSQFDPSLSETGPALVEKLSRLRSPSGWLPIWLVLLGAMFVLSRRRSGRRLVLMTVAGFVGMVLETVLLLEYQVQHGVLYQDIGLLLTLLMSGLAVGSLGYGVLTRRMRASSRLLQRVFIVEGLLPQLMLVLIGAGVAVVVTAAGGLFSTGTALFFVGATVAATFVQTSSGEPGEQQRLVAPVYAADLFGGCVGSVVATVVFIPCLGFAPASWAMAAAGLSTVAVAASSMRR